MPLKGSYFRSIAMFQQDFMAGMGKHNELGKEGEQIAVDYLLARGYDIIYRNYRYLKAEIDIIARKDATLVVVEVKSRTSSFLEDIADTVTKKKIKLLVMGTDHFVTENNLEVEVRFDIITILKTKKSLRVEHLKDAFYHF